MALYPSFIRVDVTSEMQAEARYHALRRTRYIVRQFKAEGAPLSAVESNYIGALGEIVTRSYYQQSIELSDNYTEGRTDSGDIQLDGLNYDIKSEAVPFKAFQKLYSGTIQPYEPYGCRVYTVKHLHHLNKYNGGIIFVAFPIADEARQERENEGFRSTVMVGCTPGLILGLVQPNVFEDKKPQQYSPPHPKTGRRLRYYSDNYVFQVMELTSVTALIP